MKIFTRRNALIGFLALRALRRARRNAAIGYLAAQGVEHTRARRRGGRALKVMLYATLALVSFGILAAALGFRRRRSPVSEATEAFEPPADAGAEPVSETASEPDAVDAMEPAPVT